MGLRIIELRERQRRQQAAHIDAEVRAQAKRYGDATADPQSSEEAFLYKIKAIRSQFKEGEDYRGATHGFVSNLKKIPATGGLPVSNIDPSLLLELL